MEREYLIKPMLDESYKKVSHGQGVYLYDTSGKKYLDGSSGAVTCSIGHGVSEIVEAMAEQAREVSFVYRSQFSSHAAEGLAKKLAEMTPGDLNWTFLVNSGSEAIETAMKTAIQFFQEKNMPKKTKIISRWMSYHGITIGALSLSGYPERRFRFQPLLEANPVVSPAYCYRCPYGLIPSSCKAKCTGELETAIRRIGADHVAAFVAEPVVGAAGAAITPPEGYYEKIRDICDRNDILFIADEVMTGIGRTGKTLAMEHWGALPDIVALGKGLSAGYAPVAATLISDRVMRPIQQGSKLIMSGHTYSANPQSAAVSLAVLHYIEKNQLNNAAFEKGKMLIKNLQKLQKKTEIIGDVRGKGLLIGIEFVMNQTTKQPFPKSYNLTNRIIKKANQNGLLVYPSAAGIEGGDGDAILIAPPLNINDEELNELIHLFTKTTEEIEAEVLPMS
ncbi:aspartate aminotransferase family protein [Metabacillus hrfriensis]|uniref:Aspartate aminotransferase family protein n=1 Tax=Metabacillus hrfriensis TaxID=3048891 RepID=A0ACD4R641_9BACI|nr:aspartate aminotransferase family protein [Metabacillus sp. CT-WN-B3]WHZ55923.1 aspartate aminotransferase family protein [Metabacillus sp. CT-WN-B3]